MSRARKLTPGLRQRFCDAIASGRSIPDAARLVGIAVGTPHKWMQWGEAEGSGGDYWAFRQAVIVAREAWTRRLFETRAMVQPDWPQSAEELNAWFEETCGVRLPGVAVCPGHTSPLEFVWGMFTHQTNDAIVLGSRTAGKTLALALLHVANAHFKAGFETTHYGAIAYQAKRAYQHYKMATSRNEELRKRIVSLLKTSAEWENGSSIEILPATFAAANSGHPNLVSFDELDSASSREAFDATRAMPKEYVAPDGAVYPGQYVITSTRAKRAGLMQAELDAAADNESRVYEWCALETLTPCTIPKSSIVYEYFIGRDTTKCDGWRSLKDLEATRRRMRPEVFEAQVLNRRPDPGSIMFSTFTGDNVTADAEWKPGAGQMYLAYDWGFNDPTYIGFVQFRDGVLYLFDELIGNAQVPAIWVRMAIEKLTRLEGYEGGTIEEWQAAWEARGAWPKEPDIWPVAAGDPTAAALYQSFEEHHFRLIQPGEVKHRVEEGNDFLRAAFDNGTRARLFVHQRCRHFIEAAQNYQAEQLPDGSYGERADPSPSNHKWSHPLDAVRNLVYPFRYELGLEGQEWFVR